MDIKKTLILYLKAWKNQKWNAMINLTQDSWLAIKKDTAPQLLKGAYRDLQLIWFGDPVEEKSVNGKMFTFSVNCVLRVHDHVTQRTLHPNVIIEGESIGVNPISVFRGIK